jgi:hypothetical protein
VFLGAGGKIYKKYIHRLLAEAFIPNPHNYPYVCHRDDIGHNNQLGNLYWGNAKTNSNDAAKNGTRFNLANHVAKNNLHPNAKLNEQEVSIIKRLLRGHCVTQKSISEKFGVYPSLVNRIALGKTWAHIQ